MGDVVSDPSRSAERSGPDGTDTGTDDRRQGDAPYRVNRSCPAVARPGGVTGRRSSSGRRILPRLLSRSAALCALAVLLVVTTPSTFPAGATTAAASPAIASQSTVHRTTPSVPPVGGRATFTTHTTVLPGAASAKKPATAKATPRTSGPATGLFETPQPVPLGSLTDPGGGVTSVDTGHFTSSGHLDAAAIICNPCPSPMPAGYQSSTDGTFSIAVLLGNGDGTFQAPTQLSPVGAGVPLSMIVTADLGNGHTDLIVSEGGPPDQILVYLGNGDGTFQPTPITVDAPDPIARIQVADLGDGHVDVVGLLHGPNEGSTDNGIVVFTGDGSGHLTAGAPVPLPTGAPTDLVVAPLTSSGKPDILATVNTGSKTNSLSVLLNNGSGVFPATATNPNDEDPYPEGMEVGHFSGGTNPPDVLLTGVDSANSFTNSCQVLLVGKGDGTFADPTTTDATPLEQDSIRGPEDDAPFDLNGDGSPDALWVPTYSNESTNNEMVEVATGNASGAFTTQDVVGTLPANVQENAVLPADLAGTRQPDLLVTGSLEYGQPTTDTPDSGLWVVEAKPKSPGTFENGQGSSRSRSRPARTPGARPTSPWPWATSATPATGTS